MRRLPCSLVVLSLKQIYILQAFATPHPDIFNTLKIFACLDALLRIILNRVNSEVWLLRIKALVFKILNLSITLIKLSYNIL